MSENKPMNLIERILCTEASFRGKQRLLIMMVCFVVLVPSLFCYLFYSYVFFNRESRARLKALADIVAADVGAALAFSDHRSIARSLESLKADSSIKQLLVLDEQGLVRASYSQQNEEVTRQNIEAVRSDTGRHFFELRPRVKRLIVRNGVVLGSVIIEQDQRIIMDRVVAAIETGFVILLISLFLSYLLAARFARIVTGPLATMAETMREVSITKNFSVRVPVSDTEELGQLAGSFNHMLEEISERDDALLDRQERLNQQANFDILTNLPNRSLFGDRLEQALRHALRSDECLAVLFIDLDDFKLINDTHGHRTGDLLLRETAARLESGIRNEDTVARLSGDEFIIFLHDIKNAENALRVAKKHLEALLAPYMIEEKRLFVSASIGLALFPEHAVTAEALIKSADTAMYLAKQKGKNNIKLFSALLHQNVSERLGLGNDLHRALEQGELELFYQPRICLPGKMWVGVEALLRWHHPEFGMIPPDKFIPLAEQNGLILPIGEWVIREACRHMRQWRRHGINIPKVSLNVSPLQLQRQDLVGLVRDSLVSSQLCSRSLEIEITESALMENVEQSISILQELRSIGVFISIDDFGTGYSSLSHLRNLPINILKIDRSFVLNVHESKEDAQILSAIIAMAHSLRLEVVAEGVEHGEQERVLARLGCSEVQGYYYARPMPANELPDLFMSTFPHSKPGHFQIVTTPGMVFSKQQALSPSPMEADPAFLASKYPAIRRLGAGRYSVGRSLPDCRRGYFVVAKPDEKTPVVFCQQNVVRPAVCNGGLFCRNLVGRHSCDDQMEKPRDADRFPDKC